MKLSTCLLPVLLAFGNVSSVQDRPLTNEGVVKMVRSGLGSDLIVTMVSTSACEFETDVESVLSLKEAGVPEEVIRAMLLKAAGKLEISACASPSGSDESMDAAASRIPSYTGVYFRKEGDWLEILPEVVNWKTGGVLKSVATGGVIDLDVNGKIEGALSPASVLQPLDCIINTPEGVAITEYQLIRLHKKKIVASFEL